MTCTLLKRGTVATLQVSQYVHNLDNKPGRITKGAELLEIIAPSRVPIDPCGCAHVKNSKFLYHQGLKNTQSKHMSFKNQDKIEFVLADRDNVNISSLAYQQIVFSLGGSNSAGVWLETVTIAVVLPCGRNVNSTYLLLLHVEHK